MPLAEAVAPGSGRSSVRFRIARLIWSVGRASPAGDGIEPRKEGLGRSRLPVELAQG